MYSLLNIINTFNMWSGIIWPYCVNTFSVTFYIYSLNMWLIKNLQINKKPEIIGEGL